MQIYIFSNPRHLLFLGTFKILSSRSFEVCVKSVFALTMFLCWGTLELVIPVDLYFGAYDLSSFFPHPHLLRHH